RRPATPRTGSRPRRPCARTTPPGRRGCRSPPGWRRPRGSWLAFAVEVVLHDPPVPAGAVALQRVAVAGRPGGARPHRLDPRLVLVVEDEVEGGERRRQPAGVARPDDGGGDQRLVEHVADGDGGDVGRGAGAGMAVGDGATGGEQLLEQVPAAELLNDQAILDQRAVVEGEARVG